MVPADTDTGTYMNQRFAFPLQLHPRIYGILFLLFASKAKNTDGSPVKNPVPTSMQMFANCLQMLRSLFGISTVGIEQRALKALDKLCCLSDCQLEF